MNYIVGGIRVLLAVLAWIASTVPAPGWWKLAAVVFPPYLWHLMAERALRAWCLLSCA